MRHDAWGVVLETTAPGFQPFGVARGLYDHETELVRFGAWDYDPQIGRWMAKDPIRFDGEPSSAGPVRSVVAPAMVRFRKWSARLGLLLVLFVVFFFPWAYPRTSPQIVALVVSAACTLLIAYIIAARRDGLAVWRLLWWVGTAAGVSYLGACVYFLSTERILSWVFALSGGPMAAIFIHTAFFGYDRFVRPSNAQDELRRGSHPEGC